MYIYKILCLDSPEWISLSLSLSLSLCHSTTYSHPSWRTVSNLEYNKELFVTMEIVSTQQQWPWFFSAPSAPGWEAQRWSRERSLPSHQMWSGSDFYLMFVSLCLGILNTKTATVWCKVSGLVTSELWVSVWRGSEIKAFSIFFFFFGGDL